MDAQRYQQYMMQLQVNSGMNANIYAIPGPYGGSYMYPIYDQNMLYMQPGLGPPMGHAPGHYLHPHEMMQQIPGIPPMIYPEQWPSQQPVKPNTEAAVFEQNEINVISATESASEPSVEEKASANFTDETCDAEAIRRGSLSTIAEDNDIKNESSVGTLNVNASLAPSNRAKGEQNSYAESANVAPSHGTEKPHPPQPNHSSAITHAEATSAECNTIKSNPGSSKVRGSWGSTKLTFPSSTALPTVVPCSEVTAADIEMLPTDAPVLSEREFPNIPTLNLNAESLGRSTAVPCAPTNSVPTSTLSPLSMSDFRRKCHLADKYESVTSFNANKIPARKPRGLVNRGNTCFRNAILQCLLSVSPFVTALMRLLLSFRHRKEIPTKLKAWPEILGFLYSMMMNDNGPSGSTTLPPLDAGITMPNICSTFRRQTAFEFSDDKNVALDMKPSTEGEIKTTAGNITNTEHSQQEDAMEFLEYLLDTLLEEEKIDLEDSEIDMTKVNSSEVSAATAGDCVETTVQEWETVAKSGVRLVVDNASREAAHLSTESGLISRLFSIRIRSEVTYGQRKTSTRFSSLLHFSLALAYSLPLGNVSIVDALDAYFRENIANKGSGSDEQTNAWGVGRDKQPEDKKKEMRTREKMDSLPPVLVLQLKRFNYDRKRGSAVKVPRAIEYPEILTMKTEYFSEELVESMKMPAAKHSLEGVKYRLCGIVLHHGEAITSGHYTAIVVTGSGDHKYAHLDDAKISPLSTPQALSALSEVYVLMYAKL